MQPVIEVARIEGSRIYRSMRLPTIRHPAKCARQSSGTTERTLPRILCFYQHRPYWFIVVIVVFEYDFFRI